MVASQGKVLVFEVGLGSVGTRVLVGKEVRVALTGGELVGNGVSATAGSGVLVDDGVLVIFGRALVDVTARV